MRTGEFWLALLERSVRAGSAAVLSVWIVGDGILNAFDVDWGNAGGVFLGSAVVSALVSIVASGVNANGTSGSPSLTGAERLTGSP